MIIHVTAKCSDCSSIHAYTKDCKRIELQGYVLEGIGIGGRDYVRFSLDTETGKIENWAPITDEDLIEIFEDAGADIT